MYLLRYNVDNLSLMALTIATGFVVDDAIVVLENTTRHMEMGATALQAALLGAKEITFTVMSMSISLVAVFIPLLLMADIPGRLLREFAVTLKRRRRRLPSVASLTVTPMMCGRFLKPGNNTAHGKVYKMSEALFDGMRRRYEITLRWALGHPRFMLTIGRGLCGSQHRSFCHHSEGVFP